VIENKAPKELDLFASSDRQENGISHALVLQMINTFSSAI